MKLSIPFHLYGLLLSAIFLSAACHTTQPAKSDTALFTAGATPKLISKQFGFTEGPAADKKGNVYFTDQPHNAIWIYNTKGQLRLFMDNAGRANGLYFDREDNLLACADEQNQLWRINKQKQVTVLLHHYKGKQLNGPNDVWVHPSGAIYFTDPYYERPYWTGNRPEGTERYVYLLTKEGEAVPVVKNLQQPNGIIGTPDGKWIYVADIGAGKTFKYGVQPDGSLDKGVLFVAQGSDGMTLDEKGNVYLTGNGVTVYNPQGDQIAHIPVPQKWTANVTFGGKKRNQLFITASEAIYILEMQVRGAR